MNEVLTKAIYNLGSEDNPLLDKLFAVEFDSIAKWRKYIKEHFEQWGNSFTVEKILDKSIPKQLFGGEKWGSIKFQALYIACWIYQPVEKGAYMITLTKSQNDNVQQNIEKLTARLSSHVEHGFGKNSQGYSARGGHNFKFINGYHELLVILDKEKLFLKMESHRASAPAHLADWYHKSVHGEGKTANQQLNDLALNNKNLEIKQRAAENYNTNYDILRKWLGLKTGNMLKFTQVDEALKKRFNNRPFLSGTPKNENLSSQGQFLYRINPALHSNNVRGTPFQDLVLEVSKKVIGGVTNSLMGNLEKTQKLQKAMNSLLDDLDNLYKQQSIDTLQKKMYPSFEGSKDRIFQEIILNPQMIDEELKKFMNFKRGPTY